MKFQIPTNDFPEMPFEVVDGKLTEVKMNGRVWSDEPLTDDELAIISKRRTAALKRTMQKLEF